jgi:hypothetical protein
VHAAQEGVLATLDVMPVKESSVPIPVASQVSSLGHTLTRIKIWHAAAREVVADLVCRALECHPIAGRVRLQLHAADETIVLAA